MQRKIFAKQLMMLIRKSGMRQIEVASKIGVSSAAISQFVHGTTLPSLTNMKAIFDVLRIPIKTRNQIQYQLMLARAESRFSSEDNSGLALMHMRAGAELSIDEVAARSDMSVERLAELESGNVNNITAEEKEKLSAIYGIDFDTSEAAVEEASDISSLYKRGGAPQIMVSDLLSYDGKENIAEFAWQNIRNFVSHKVKGVSRPVVAQAFSNEVGFLHDGLLQIFLSQTRPAGYAQMELRMYDGGVFRLWQPGLSDKRSQTPSFETHGTLIWSLPVVEVILQPLKMKAK